eukprot:TRINITY_DN112830_c0_g1_i1.p1 TRINITY_DN112830_c0_g1~~TRINITY_DN112830_c0_g1_i1.p1  ORF type:complete len:499 (+),score=80.12 TRINITY_DN112830_c0_g1_i1:102-1598(+)
MPVVTPLTRNILLAGGATVAVGASGAVPGWMSTVAVGLLSLIGAVCATPPPTDSKMTAMDRFMVNIERVMKGKFTYNHCAVVFRFSSDTTPTAKVAQEWMAKVCAAYPRFGSVAVASNFVEFSTWERCEDLDWSYHLVEHSAVASDADMQAKVTEVINSKLDSAKPRWVLDIIPNKAGGQGVAVMRFDHCMGDGLRFVKAARGFITFEDGSPAELALLKAMSAKKRDASKKMGKGPSFWLRVVKDFFKVLALEKLPAEDSSCFHEPKTLFPATCKYAAVTSEVQLSDLKDIKSRMPAGTTLNDVVLTAFCGALRKYSANVAKHDIKPDQLMRAFCAVALPDMPGRPAEDMYNNFVMPSFEMPIGASQRDARLSTAHKTMEELKTSLTGPITQQLSGVLGRLGLDALAGDTQLKVFPLHSFVYSNVPSFEQPAYLFGGKHKIENLEVYYPNLISQTIFFSYCDKMMFSLTTDPTVVAKPRALVDAFVEEVAEWHKVACS